MANKGDGHDKSGDLTKSAPNVVHLKVPRKKKTSSNTAKSKKQTVVVTSSTSEWSKKSKNKKTSTTSSPNDPTSHVNTQYNANNEQLINLPPYTKYLLGTLVAIHLLVTFALNQEQMHWVYIHLGFIPGRFTGAALFEPLALITPFTHLFLHGSWLHIAMNGVMLLAFGAGIEKLFGGKKMIALFVLCGLFGLAAHFALNFQSYQPIIGASGGLSGLFAIAILTLNRGIVGGKHGVWPLIGLWVGISIVFGMIGSPDGAEIAWAAHVGGFLGGCLLIKVMKLR